MQKKEILHRHPISSTHTMQYLLILVTNKVMMMMQNIFFIIPLGIYRLTVALHVMYPQRRLTRHGPKVRHDLHFSVTDRPVVVCNFFIFNLVKACNIALIRQRIKMFLLQSAE